jgi:hypothetical protein
MTEEELIQIVELINDADSALMELNGRLDWQADEMNAREAFDRAWTAVRSARAIFDA